MIESVRKYWDPVVIGKEETGPKGAATHHRDYFRFMLNYYPKASYIAGGIRQLKSYFVPGRLILLDFEGNSFKFAPLVALRSLLLCRTDIYTVALSNLLGKSDHARKKRFVFRCLKALPGTTILHTGDEDSLKPYYNKQYIDFQYWDLKHIREPLTEESFQARISGFDPHKTLLFIGRFDIKRGADFVREIVRSEKPLPFHLHIWSGSVPDDFVTEVEGREDVSIDLTFPSFTDIVNAHLYFKHLLLYYPESVRTSGFFGRGIQCGNYLYVSSDFHTFSEFEYPRVNNVSEPGQLIDSLKRNFDKPWSPGIICEFPYKLI